MRTLAKLTWVELKLFTREPVTLVFTVILPLIMLIMMGEVFGRSPASPEAFRGVNAMIYYTPAYIGVVVSAVGIVAIPVHLAGYRERGILRRLRASSLPIRSWFASQVTVSIIITIICMFILLIPAVLFYEVSIPQSLGLVIGGSALAIISFTALGIFLGLVLPTARAAQGVGMPLWFFMFIVSGAAPPREVLSTLMRDAGQALPLWHVTSVVQDAWLDGTWNVVASLVLIGVIALAGIISFLVFRRE